MASVGKGSRSKGSNYERAVAKKFTDWWIPKGSKAEFHRVPASGALQWADDHRVAGDIIAPDGFNFPFVIECKKHEGWIMDNVLLNTGKPHGWWEQVVTDSRRVDRIPMLVFSRNRAEDFVMIPYDSGIYDVINDMTSTLLRTPVVTKNIRDEIQIFDVIVTTLGTLSELSPEYMRTYAKHVHNKWDKYANQYK